MESTTYWTSLEERKIMITNKQKTVQYSTANPSDKVLLFQSVHLHLDGVLTSVSVKDLRGAEHYLISIFYPSKLQGDIRQSLEAPRNLSNPTDRRFFETFHSEARQNRPSRGKRILSQPPITG